MPCKCGNKRKKSTSSLENLSDEKVLQMLNGSIAREDYEKASKLRDIAIKREILETVKA
jgi:protein-arginine kinase activator protein McsA